MLQAIRSKATSFVVKLLFGLLIITFGVWGIGDIFRTGNTDTSVAKVGDRTISAEQLTASVRDEMQRMRGIFGNNSLDIAQAKQMGIVDKSLNGLIDNNLVELEIKRLGLGLGDAPVSQAIVANPNFHDATGKFDPTTYANVLKANRMSSSQFEALMRSDLLRAQLIGALGDGLTPPKKMVDTLYSARAERRVADTILLPPSAAGETPKPTEDEVNAFYQAHPDRFRAPERRSFQVATLRTDDVAAGIALTDDKLQQEYKSRQDEFHEPEQRQLKQMLLPDKATAEKAAAALAAGKSFDEAGKEFANADASSLDLGWMKRDDLPQELAGAAFDLKDGETTAPIQSSFGWHLIKVDGIKPEETQSFEQAKDKLKLEVQRDMAGDQIARAANQIDDALAGGMTLDAVAQKFGLKLTSVADVDAEGQDAEGKSADIPTPGDAVLKAAFATDGGQTSPLTEMGEGDYLIVHVDKVTPAALKPLAEVHDQAVKEWQDEARATALGKIADEITQEIKGGKSLKDVAEARKLTVVPTPALQRTGGSDKVPPALAAKLFDAKQGEIVATPLGEGYIVAQLTTIQAADPTQNDGAVKQLTGQISQSMQNELLSEYTQALRRLIPVTINQANVDRAL